MHAASGQVGISFGEGSLLVPVERLDIIRDPDDHGTRQPAGVDRRVNNRLVPQRAVSFEAGARGRIGRSFSYSVAGFLGRITDAIVPYTEIGGRAYFQNAGRLRNDASRSGSAENR